MKFITQIHAILLLSACLLAANITIAQDGVAIEGYTVSGSNLAVATFKNGDPIPQAKTAEEWAKAAEEGTPAWCYMNNDAGTEATYGKLYNWFAVNDARGLAPEGWHIPTEEEYHQFITKVKEKYSRSGNALKNKEAWKNGGDDYAGFNAYPAGMRREGGAFDYEGRLVGFWSSTEISWRQEDAKYFYLNDDSWHFSDNSANKGRGMAIRCFKD